MHKSDLTSNIIRITNLSELQKMLNAQRWFEKTSEKASVTSIEILPIRTIDRVVWAHLTIGTPQNISTYRVPLLRSSVNEINITSHHSFRFKDDSGQWWTDALESRDFRNWLLNYALGTEDSKHSDCKESLERYRDISLLTAIPPYNGESIINQTDQTNCCVFFESLFFLKFYRKVEHGNNHECEIIRRLSAFTESHSKYRIHPTLYSEVRDLDSTAYAIFEQINCSTDLWKYSTTLLKNFFQTKNCDERNTTLL